MVLVNCTKERWSRLERFMGSGVLLMSASICKVPRFARQVDFGFCTVLVLVVRCNNILVKVWYR